MKGILCATTGLWAAVAGLLIWDSRRPRAVQELANKLEAAWSDHRTKV